MAVRIGHASKSEKNTINGTKGDSTKTEVCTRTWYNKGWDFMAIHPDAVVREKHAVAVEDACDNNNIGYGQNDRNSLYPLAKAAKYALSKITKKCNCDCSSLQNVCAIASGANVTYGSNGWTTSNMKAKLKAAGYIIIEKSIYLTSEEYCVRGAIYVKAGSHTVCGLDNGSKANKTLSVAGISDSSNTSKDNDSTSIKIGDIVTYSGTVHYTSSYAKAKRKTCKGGTAKVTAINKGKPHPYHLVHAGKGCTVYGWVDADKLSK